MAGYNDSTQSGDPVNSNAAFAKNSVLSIDRTASILDKDWAHQAFLLASVSTDTVGSVPMAPIDIRNRSFSSAELKFTDTSLGGNYAINAKPQFNQYADIRAMGRISDRQETTLGAINGNLGMGRYYSEAFDDNAQTIHMRFGVPQFNSLTKFFTGFYNVSAGRLARTGRADTFFGGFAQDVGFVWGIVAQIYIWPIAVIAALGYVGSFIFGRETSKFYYFKDTMPTYWGAVNSLTNKIAVGRGLFPLELVNPTDQNLREAYKLDEQVLLNLHSMMPDVFSKDGGYDIYKAANKAERYRIANDRRIYENFNSESNSDFYGKLQKEGQTKLNKPEQDNTSYSNMIQQWLTSFSAKVGEGDKDGNTFERDIRTNADGTLNKNKADQNSFLEHTSAMLNDGGRFATFRVDYTGPVTESFSNSVRESDISSKVNSIAGQAKSARFNFAGGNVIGGAIGAVGNEVAGVVTGFLSGVLESVQLSGLVGLAGGSFVDFPKHWDSSSASLPKSNYSIQLTSPYGNVVSQMQNIYIPLCMLLAGALPLSTGKQSYTSPFILELYDKGRHQTRLGMIDSLSVTRGTSNLGFNRNGNAMAIDVNFTVVDMSSVLHMQIAKGFLSNDDNGIFDEETVFSDYMNTLSSLGVKEQFHTMSKAHLRLARSVRNLQSLSSAAAWAGIVVDKTPIGYLEGLYRGTRRP